MRMQSMRGGANYHAGLMAEACVAAHYQASGRAIEARRWRGRSGEIDLVARDDEGLIFIEVKASRDFATAAEHLNRRQMDRLCGAASEFMAGEETGQLTPMRFDVALVDRLGRIEVIENAFGLN